MKARWIGFILVIAILAAAFATATAQEPRQRRAVEIAGQRINVDQFQLIESTTNSEGQPEAVKIPATHRGVLACIQEGREMRCTEMQGFECPSSIVLVDADGAGWKCDVDCHGGQVDGDGNCDCDVQMDTCRRN